MDPQDYSRCLSRLQKLCSKAEYCTSDVYRKALKALEGDAEAAIDTAMKLADFKVRHANVWIPRFFTRVAEKAEHEFYLTAADLGTFLCEVDGIEDEAPKAQ